MDAITTQDAAGRRTVVQLRDSRDTFRWSSNGVNIRGQSQLQEIISIPLVADPDYQPRPRPALKRGQILVSAHVAFNSGALNYVLADVRVSGFVGSTGTVIASAQLGGNNPLLRVPFTDKDTFDRVSVEARMIVNGQPSSATTDISDATVVAVVDMWE